MLAPVCSVFSYSLVDKNIRFQEIGFLFIYIYYGEFIAATSVYFAGLLTVSMAIIRLSIAWPGVFWTKWLPQRRPYFGVAMFAYMDPHLLAYLAKIGAYAGVLKQAAEPGV